MENSKRPANPITDETTKDQMGLTKREYFAAMAMQGMISGRELELSQVEANVFACQAIQFADELLKQLDNN